MALDHPYPVYGRVRDNTGYLSGVTVNAVDITAASSTINAETGTNGEYFVDIMDIASNGHTIEISATYGGKDGSKTFVLDISGPAQEIDLFLFEAGAFIMKLGWVAAE